MRIALVSVFLMFCQLLCGQIDPSSIPGLELWVNADIGVTANVAGAISQWNDQSGNNRNLSQSIANRRPLILEDYFFGRSSVKFDGANDYLDFPAISNIRTIFWVLAESESPTVGFKGLLGHSATFDFIRGGNGNLWNPAFSDPNILNGSTRLQFENFDGVNNPLPSGYQVVSLQTLDIVEADRFNRDRGVTSTVWDGELLQLLIFSSVLTPEEVEGVEEYLADYYTPEFSLGPDITIPYGFCDTMLVASPGFPEYTWSSDLTNDTIHVNETGWYWAEVNGPFGRVLRDSVFVHFPGNLQLENSQLCFGESISWNTELNPEFYTFQWQDNSNLPTYSTSEEGSVSVTINDTLGCIFMAGPAQVNVDFFANEASLGPDISLCVGESIGLSGGEVPGLIYLWSNGVSTPSIVYGGESDIFVEVTNLNGCVAYDTIAISSNGFAPIVDFSYQFTCETDLTEFLNLTQSDTELSSFIWNFNGEETIEIENTTFQFNDFGVYEVLLSITDINGCSGSISKWVQIFPIPEASFQYTFACESEQVIFFDNSQIEEGNVINWEWVFPDYIGTGVISEYTFDEPGFVPVTLIVESNEGCFDEISINVNVNPAPQAAITFTNPCFGSLTTFGAIINNNGAGEVAEYFWAFGDATSSIQDAPLHLYPNPGFYNVYLEVLSENGCSGNATSLIQIYSLPQVNLSHGPLCAGEIASINDASISESDDMVAWHWDIASIGEYDDESIQVVFQEIGQYDITLEVSTLSGCFASDEFSVEVSPSPEISFGYNPPIGAAPISFSFNAGSDIPCTFSWDFGDGNFAEGPNVNHVFESNNTYIVTLTGISENGCASVFENDILVSDPYLDLIITNAEISAQGNMIVDVLNASNFSVQGIWMFQRTLNNEWIKEFWPIELSGGVVNQFTFASSLSLVGESSICALVNYHDNSYPDVRPENNEFCLKLEDVQSLQLYPAYPNPSSGNVDIAFIIPRNEKVEIELYSHSGQIVWKGSHNAIEGYNRFSIDISELSAGLYTLSLLHSNQRFNTQIMRE